MPSQNYYSKLPVIRKKLKYLEIAVFINVYRSNNLTMGVLKWRTMQRYAPNDPFSVHRE